MLESALAWLSVPSVRGVTAAEMVEVGPLLVLGALIFLAVVVALLLGTGRIAPAPRSSDRAPSPPDESPTTPSDLKVES